MLRIITVFAVLTLLAGAYGFGWITGERSGPGRAVFWIFAGLLALLILRAVTSRRGEL